MAQWKVDPDHAVAAFTIRHMMVTIVRGQFNKVTGTIIFDPANVADTSAEVEVDTTSLYTGVDRRDNHLRSPDFFDVEKHPVMRFKSTAVEVVSLNTFRMFGKLTIRDVTRPVLFNVEFSGPTRFVDDDKTYTTYGFSAKTTINREDFGLKWNMDIEDGGFMVGKHPDIMVNVEADLEE